MIHKTFALTAVLIWIIVITDMNAQETTLTAGGNATGDGGSVSFSVGQITFSHHTGSNGSTTQGMQQAYEIEVEKNPDVVQQYSISCKAFPNPVNDYLQLKIDTKNPEYFYYQLFDIRGNSVINGKILANETDINVSNLQSGSYILRVYEQYEFKQELKIFKIIKK